MATRSNNMDPRLIALCSAAIGIVYATGYYVTMPADREPAPHLLAASPSPPLTQDPAAGAVTSLETSAWSGKYHDGTFEGYGTTEIGSVQVEVTIKHDLITDVRITRCSTRYSQTLIDQLPAQVLVEQSHRVDTVTGATLSTRTFRAAIQNALAHASL
ncbi:MAG TPA: FMN-binding protein [Symbiobacteriaceae bacterium]